MHFLPPVTNFTKRKKTPTKPMPQVPDDWHVISGLELYDSLLPLFDKEPKYTTHGWIEGQEGGWIPEFIVINQKPMPSCLEKDSLVLKTTIDNLSELHKIGKIDGVGVVDNNICFKPKNLSFSELKTLGYGIYDKEIKPFVGKPDGILFNINDEFVSASDVLGFYEENECTYVCAYNVNVKKGAVLKNIPNLNGNFELYWDDKKADVPFDVIKHFKFNDRQRLKVSSDGWTMSQFDLRSTKWANLKESIVIDNVILTSKGLKDVNITPSSTYHSRKIFIDGKETELNGEICTSDNFVENKAFLNERGKQLREKYGKLPKDWKTVSDKDLNTWNDVQLKIKDGWLEKAEYFVDYPVPEAVHNKFTQWMENKDLSKECPVLKQRFFAPVSFEAAVGEEVSEFLDFVQPGISDLTYKVAISQTLSGSLLAGKL